MAANTRELAIRTPDSLTKPVWNMAAKRLSVTLGHFAGSKPSLEAVPSSSQETKEKIASFFISFLALIVGRKTCEL